MPAVRGRLVAPLQPDGRLVWPLVKAATNQYSQAARNRIATAIDRKTIGMIGRLAAQLIGWYQ